MTSNYYMANDIVKKCKKLDTLLKPTVTCVDANLNALTSECSHDALRIYIIKSSDRTNETKYTFVLHDFILGVMCRKSRRFVGRGDHYHCYITDLNKKYSFQFFPIFELMGEYDFQYMPTSLPGIKLFPNQLSIYYKKIEQCLDINMDNTKIYNPSSTLVNNGLW